MVTKPHHFTLSLKNWSLSFLMIIFPFLSAKTQLYWPSFELSVIQNFNRCHKNRNFNPNYKIKLIFNNRKISNILKSLIFTAIFEFDNRNFPITQPPCSLWTIEHNRYFQLQFQILYSFTIEVHTDSSRLEFSMFSFYFKANNNCSYYSLIVSKYRQFKALNSLSIQIFLFSCLTNIY